jgi:acyl-CoA synthetase (AMP-forming)/AMP-acid ligase II
MLSFNSHRESTSSFFFKKAPPDMTRIKSFWIETFIADKVLETSLLHHLESIDKSKPFHGKVSCILTLPEHGGMILATTWKGTAPDIIVSRDGLKKKVVQFVSEKMSGRHMSISTFGQLLPTSTFLVSIYFNAHNKPFVGIATVAIVDPETKALCPRLTLGEIWVQSPSLAAGFWALPKLSQIVYDSHPLFVLQNSGNNTIVPIEERFCRSGLMGFTDAERGLFILGLMNDTFKQFEFDKRFEYPLISYHFANHIVGTCFSKVVGLTGW